MKLRELYSLHFPRGCRTQYGGRADDAGDARAAGCATLSYEGSETRRCGGCAHFRNAPAYLETIFPGLTSLSSAYGSVRGEDGLCLLQDRYLGADCSCADFSPRCMSEA